LDEVKRAQCASQRDEAQEAEEDDGHEEVDGELPPSFEDVHPGFPIIEAGCDV
jgi:hypothetical protein